MTFKAFVNRYRIRVDNCYVDPTEQEEQDWPHGAHHWKSTLRCRGRQMTLRFHQGLAHNAEPTAEDILSCIAADNPHGAGFEDWCADLGYDSDSRKALRIFEACLAENVRAQKFLGDLYDEFAACTEE